VEIDMARSAEQIEKEEREAEQLLVAVIASPTWGELAKAVGAEVVEIPWR
jgi:hypothetical protein